VVEASGESGDMVRMQWLYYVLAGLAVVVLLNVVLVVFLAVASRESEEHRPADL
jgi:hypothetical protein